MWEADRIPTGPGIVKRHGALDVNWDDPRNAGGGGTPGPQGPPGPTGPQGPPGANGTNGTDGQDITWRGDWIDGTPYALQDVVRFTTTAGLQTFINTSPVTSSTPPDVDVTHWELMTESGADGAPGPTGATGPQGIPGDPAPNIDGGRPDTIYTPIPSIDGGTP